MVLALDLDQDIVPPEANCFVLSRVFYLMLWINDPFQTRVEDQDVLPLAFQVSGSHSLGTPLASVMVSVQARTIENSLLQAKELPAGLE